MGLYDKKHAGQFFDYGGHVYNVKHPTFGAKGDGVSNDGPAIQAALDAVSTLGGGTVFLPGGLYRVGSDLNVPHKVSMVGTPQTVLSPTTSGASFTRALLICGEYVAPGGTFPGGGLGNRYGTIEGIRIEGEQIAPVGLYVGGAVQRSFKNIDILYCTAQGLVVDTAQNNRFINVNAEKNGSDPAGPDDCNILLDRGAGNNVFVGCEFSADPSGTQGRYNLLFRQSAVGAVGAFTAPGSNVFLGCVVERVTSNYEASIGLRAGRNNVFVSCDLHTESTLPVFKANNDDGAASTLTRFVHCRFDGDVNQSIGLDLTNHFKAILDSCFFENLDILGTGDANSRIVVVGDANIGSVNTLFSGNVVVSWGDVRSRPGVQTDRGDNDVTLRVGVDERSQRFNTPLTANRTVTLSTTGAIDGAVFRVVRTTSATGAFTLSVGGLKSLAAGEWCDVEYSGSWKLAAFGAL